MLMRTKPSPARGCNDPIDRAPRVAWLTRVAYLPRTRWFISSPWCMSKICAPAASQWMEGRWRRWWITIHRSIDRGPARAPGGGGYARRQDRHIARITVAAFDGQATRADAAIVTQQFRFFFPAAAGSSADASERGE